MSIIPKKPRGRPRKSETMDTLAVRLPDDLVERVENYIEALQAQLPGINVTRADAIRQLLIVGLNTEEERIRK